MIKLISIQLLQCIDILIIFFLDTSDLLSILIYLTRVNNGFLYLIELTKYLAIRLKLRVWYTSVISYDLKELVHTESFYVVRLKSIFL